MTGWFDCAMKVCTHALPPRRQNLDLSQYFGLRPNFCKTDRAVELLYRGLSHTRAQLSQGLGVAIKHDVSTTPSKNESKLNISEK